MDLYCNSAPNFLVRNVLHCRLFLFYFRFLGDCFGTFHTPKVISIIARKIDDDKIYELILVLCFSFQREHPGMIECLVCCDWVSRHLS